MLRLSGFELYCPWVPQTSLLKGKHFPQGALRTQSNKL